MAGLGEGDEGEGDAFINDWGAYEFVHGKERGDLTPPAPCRAPPSDTSTTAGGASWCAFTVNRVAVPGCGQEATPHGDTVVIWCQHRAAPRG